MIRIDSIWLATELMDMRAGTETALARVVAVFGAAKSHCAYLFANRRANRLGAHLITQGVMGARLHFFDRSGDRVEEASFVISKNTCFSTGLILLFSGELDDQTTDHKSASHSSNHSGERTRYGGTLVRERKSRTASAVAQ